MIRDCIHNWRRSYWMENCIYKCIRACNFSPCRVFEPILSHTHADIRADMFLRPVSAPLVTVICIIIIKLVARDQKVSPTPLSLRCGGRIDPSLWEPFVEKFGRWPLTLLLNPPLCLFSACGVGMLVLSMVVLRAEGVAKRLIASCDDSETLADCPCRLVCMEA